MNVIPYIFGFVFIALVAFLIYYVAYQLLSLRSSEDKNDTSNDPAAYQETLTQLERLGNLKEKGLLSEHEFHVEKKKLLSR